jgi:hypothetical protein
MSITWLGVVADGFDDSPLLLVLVGVALFFFQLGVGAFAVGVGAFALAEVGFSFRVGVDIFAEPFTALAEVADVADAQLLVRIGVGFFSFVLDVVAFEEPSPALADDAVADDDNAPPNASEIFFFFLTASPPDTTDDFLLAAADPFDSTRDGSCKLLFRRRSLLTRGPATR